MKNKITIIFALFLIVGSYGCTKLYHLNQPKEPEIETSAVYPLSGEWWITYTVNGTPFVSPKGRSHYKIDTYNTAADVNTEMWVANYTIGRFIAKSGIDVSAKTFNGSDLESRTGGTVSITNGKVIIDGGKSKTGVTADSIYFEFTTSGAAGTTYTCQGIRRTGFLEDEW